MNYYKISRIAQLVISILLIALTLIQSKGAGLSSGLKGSFGGYRSVRGAEKVVLIVTIILAVLLVVNSVVLVILS